MLYMLYMCHTDKMSNLSFVICTVYLMVPKMKPKSNHQTMIHNTVIREMRTFLQKYILLSKRKNKNYYLLFAHNMRTTFFFITKKRLCFFVPLFFYPPSYQESYTISESLLLNVHSNKFSSLWLNVFDKSNRGSWKSSTVFFNSILMNEIISKCFAGWYLNSLLRKGWC